MSNRIFHSSWHEGKRTLVSEQEVTARALGLATELYGAAGLTWTDPKAYVDPNVIRKALAIAVRHDEAVWETVDRQWVISGGPLVGWSKRDSVFFPPLRDDRERNQIIAPDFFLQANRLVRVAEIGRVLAMFVGDRYAPEEQSERMTVHFAADFVGHAFAERLAGRRLTREQTWMGKPEKWGRDRRTWLLAWIRENPTRWREARAWFVADQARSRADWAVYERVERERGADAAREAFVERRKARTAAATEATVHQ